MTDVQLALVAVVIPTLTLSPAAAIVAGLLLCAAAVVVYRRGRHGQ